MEQAYVTNFHAIANRVTETNRMLAASAYEHHDMLYRAGLWYQIAGMPRGSTLSNVRKQMMYVIKNYHPDKLQVNLTMRLMKLCFPRVLEALQTLKDQLGGAMSESHQDA